MYKISRAASNQSQKVCFDAKILRTNILLGFMRPVLLNTPVRIGDTQTLKRCPPCPFLNCTSSPYPPIDVRDFGVEKPSLSAPVQCQRLRSYASGCPWVYHPGPTHLSGTDG